MKKIHRALALIMAIAVICCLPIQASAANEAAAVIDYSKTASLSLYKYDLTSAEADSAWDTDTCIIYICWLRPDHISGVQCPSMSGLR